MPLRTAMPPSEMNPTRLATVSVCRVSARAITPPTTAVGRALRICSTIRTDGTTDDSSCPASTDTTDTTDTTATDATAQEAEVTSFSVGDLECPSGGGDGTVSVSWETESATAARLEVDGTEVESGGPSGSADLTVPCDGADHEVSVVPLSDAGDGQPESETVSSG